MEANTDLSCKDPCEPLHEDTFEDEVGYLKWAAALLGHLLDEDEGRRRGLERKAASATAFALGVGAYSMRTVGASPHWFVAALVVLGGLASVAAIYHAFRAVRVERMKAVRETQLIDDDIFDLEVWGRYKSAAVHLRDTLNGFRKEVERTGRYADAAQASSLIAGLLFLAATLVHAL